MNSEIHEAQPVGCLLKTAEAARLVGMSRDKAHRSCTTLMRKNISCVVVRDGESGGESGIAQGSR